MNGKTNLVVKAILAEMTLVALGALLWKWRTGGFDALDPGEARRLVAQAVTMLVCPVWLAAGWGLARRRLASPRQTPSPDHVRWFETGMLVAGLMLMAAQAWTARNFVLDETLGRGALLRGMTIFVGVLTAVQGNFLAKVAPPTGVGAPEPGVWSRTMLKIGWGMAAVGVAVVACAITLPIRSLLPVLLIAVAALMVNSAFQRRRLRPSMGSR